MVYKQYIEKAIKEIDNNLSDELNITNISELCLTSSSQLYRDFYGLAGHSVKEYVRKRRISKALALIKHSDFGFQTISNMCGYATQQSFCKAVKSAIGQTPLAYKHGSNYFYFPEFRYRCGRQITVSTEAIPQTVRLAYYSSQLTGIEDRAVTKFLSLIPDYAKRIFGRNGKQVNNRFCYEIYVEITEDVRYKLSDQFIVHESIPAFSTLCAKTVVQNLDDKISGAWDYLYMDWLGTSMFEQSDILYFEEYKYKNGQADKLVLFLPIQKKVDYHKITIQNLNDMSFLISKSSGVNAEKEAARKVMEYVNSNHPHVRKDTDEYFRASYEKEYICGLRLKYHLKLQNAGDVEIFRPSGMFAVLECRCYTKSSVFEELLISWILDNGFECEDIKFTTYNTENGFDNKSIKTKIYIKIKMGISDNKIR